MEDEANERSFLSRPLARRIFFGAVSVVVCNLPVFTLKNSPITGALETELLRWRFEVMHSLTKAKRSDDIVIVYWKGPAETSAAKETSLKNLLSAVESAHPTVVGIDLSAEQIRTENLAEAIKGLPNVVVCRQSEPVLANSLIVTALTSDENIELEEKTGTGLYVETDGMASQIPNSAIVLPPKTGKSFNVEIASRYRLSRNSNALKVDSEAQRFINYENIDFDTLSSAKVLSQKIDPATFKNKIVLIGNFSPNFVIPSDMPRIHKVLGGSEILVQAFAIQSFVDGVTILPSSRYTFQAMLLALVIIEFLMPIIGHVARLFLFVASIGMVLSVSYTTLYIEYIFIQVWPFLVGIIASFIFGSVAFAVTDLQERNRNLKETQISLEKRNEELETAKKDLENRGKEIARARELGMEEERKRVALDLHDDALKELFLASSTVEKSLTNGLEPTVGKQVQAKIHEASEKIRRIMANLSPSTLTVCGLAGAIDGLTGTLREETEMEVRFDGEVGTALDSFDESQALLIYRIVQEAFNNIQKHSKATKVSVRVSVDQSILKIMIADNGVGINTNSARPDGYGLNNMKHRADLIGAQLNFGPPTEFAAGTQLVLTYRIPH